MKIFVSSLISGYEPLRAAARSAITTLRHVPTMAEDFAAQPASPQIACLRGVREADLMVLILVDRYGTIPPGSAVSPTHQEFLEARDTKPLLVFVQEGVTREPPQAKFVDEVQGWQGGFLRNSFKTADDLRDRITQAIHDHDLAHAAAPLDARALIAKASALLQAERRNQGGEGISLNVAIACGPLQRIIRPVELESAPFREAIQQEATFGASRLFDRTKGVEDSIEDDALVMEQERGALLRLDEGGTITLRLPLGGGHSRSWGSAAIIEEEVLSTLAQGIAFADWLLTRIDPTQRLVNLGIAASITGAEASFGWRTQAEHAASPNSGNMNIFGRDVTRQPVTTDRHRAALHHEAQRLAEDLMVPLRRLHKTR